MPFESSPTDVCGSALEFRAARIDLCVVAAVAFGVSVQNGQFEPNNCLPLAHNREVWGDGKC
jgi:hypothetical protein